MVIRARRFPHITEEDLLLGYAVTTLLQGEGAFSPVSDVYVVEPEKRTPEAGVEAGPRECQQTEDEA